jgi:flagellar hook assembly protein FlgD
LIRGSAHISYAIQHGGYTSLKVFDAAGRVVRSLVSAERKPGRYTVNWDGRDAQGRTLARGVYFMRLQSPDFGRTRKVVITR